MTDITSWLGSGDPPALDSLLDLSDTFGHTENHPIQNMELSLLDNETVVDGYWLFDEYNSLDLVGPNESAIQTQPDLMSSNFLQDTDFPGLENLPEVFVGESHDSVQHEASSLVVADSETTNRQRRKRPGSPTLRPPQPSRKKRLISSRSSKRRARLSPNAKKVLEDFFACNIYPDPNDVATLVQQTGTQEQQIKTWFRNQRSRKIVLNDSNRTNARINNISREHNLNSATPAPAAFLETGRNGDLEEISQSPIEPSEQNFATKLAKIPCIDPKSLMERYLGVPLEQDHRMPIITTQVVEPPAAAGSDGSWSSGGSQKWSRRRGRRKMNIHHITGPYDLISDPYRFHCTFCGKGLKNQYQWRRHEETMHAPRTGWICKDIACANKPIEDSIFFREDLFTQHRIKHAPHEQPSTDFETVSANPIPEAHPTLQCGFCGERFPNWADRVTHIAAHFEQGANLSSWWLKRAEFISQTKDSTSLWPHDCFKAVLPHSVVICIYCERIYRSLEDAEAQHHECTVWSCGLFEGIQAAYDKSTRSECQSWSCIYCGVAISEVAPHYSERLSHLIKKHAYRSCTPRIFSELSNFQDHLRSHHNTLRRGTTNLESACRLTRKSLFRSVADIPSTGAAPLYFTHTSDANCHTKVNILGRSFHGYHFFTSTRAYFDLRSPHNIIGLEALRSLQPTIDLQMDRSDGPVVDAPAGHVGHIVIQWSGTLGVQLSDGFLLPAPGLHETKVSVVDGKRMLTFGYAAIEELKMVPKYQPRV